MSDRPIIFSAPMVRALLDGRKTQTRRLVSPDTCTVNGCRVRRASAEWRDLDFARAKVRDQSTLMLAAVGPDAAPPDHHLDVPLLPPNEDMRYRVRTIIEPGDRLWVREAWAHDGPDLDSVKARHEDAAGAGFYYGPYYRATEPAPETLRWRPSIHMPRWASRLTLDATAVKVERLQEISREDAIAEGCESPLIGTEAPAPAPGVYLADERTSFAQLWNRLHGEGAWRANPWVVAITFNVRHGNIDA